MKVISSILTIIVSTQVVTAPVYAMSDEDIFENARHFTLRACRI